MPIELHSKIWVIFDQERFAFAIHIHGKSNEDYIRSLPTSKVNTQENDICSKRRIAGVPKIP